MTTQSSLLTIGDYEARAKQTMPRALFDRLFGDLGAPDWITNTSNVTAMSEVKLAPSDTGGTSASATSPRRCWARKSACR